MGISTLQGLVNEQENVGAETERTNLKSSEIIEKITQQLETEGKPGSAEYVKLYFYSLLLDKELDAYEKNPSYVAETIDIEKTTREMLEKGEVVLKEDIRFAMLGCTNLLRFKLDKYVLDTANRAATFYAEYLSQGRNLAQKAFAQLKRKPIPFDIPFETNPDETEALRELGQLRYTSMEEGKELLRHELLTIMRRRPESIGLVATAKFAFGMKNLSNILGGDPKEPIDTQNLRIMHELMTGRGAMEELGIDGKTLKDIKDKISEEVGE